LSLHAGSAIRNASLYRQAQQELAERKQYEAEMEAISRVSTVLRMIVNRAEIMAVIPGQMIDLFKADGVIILMLNPTRDDLFTEVCAGVLEVYHRRLFIPDNDWVDFLETLAEQAAICGRSF